MKKETPLFRIAKALLIIAVFAVAIFASASRKSNAVSLMPYITSEVQYSNGTTASFPSANFGLVGKGDTVTVSVAIPETPLKDDPDMCFYAYHSVTEVRMGDTLLESYGAELAERGNLIGSKHFRIRLPDDCWGKTVTITFHVYENNAFNRLNGLYLYSAAQSYQYFMDGDFIGFWVCFPVLLVGCVALLMLLFNGSYGAITRKGVYISVFAILASGWIMTSGDIQEMFGWHGYGWIVMEYVALFVLPIPLVLYGVESEPKGTRMRRLLEGTTVADTVVFLFATVLQCTGIAHYCATLALAHIMIVISGTLMLVYAARRKRSEDRSENVMLSGMMILFSAGLVDVMRFNIVKYIPGFSAVTIPSIFALGVLFFIIYILRSYIDEAADSQRVLLTERLKADSLNELVANTPAGICVVSLNGKGTILQANDMFYSIFGYTKESAQRAGFDNLHFPLMIEKGMSMDEHDQAILQGKEPCRYEKELPVKKADGSTAVVYFRFYYHGRKDPRVTASAFDITERKKMEEELRVSERRYRLALTQSGKVFFFLDVPTRTMHLSDELAQAFGMPKDVDNMPDNFIAQGLVEPQSVQDYRDFYARIFRGEPSGSTIISCHMAQAPEETLWYRIAFTSVLDGQGVPQSAIITYEDLQDQRESEIAGAWKQQNLVTVPEERWAVAEFDLTADKLLRRKGAMVAEMKGVDRRYDSVIGYMLDHMIWPEDVENCRAFLDRQHLLAVFAAGDTEGSREFRAIGLKGEPNWIRVTVQLISDPYSGNVLMQSVWLDINSEKTGQLEMQHDMEQLKKELENSRIRIMINQMQPHFLYNALSAIQTIVKTDPDYAYQLIYDFTVHLRSSIKALSSDAPIPFKDELKNIKAYLNIEQMRFGDCLKINYDIECEDFKVIPLSIQPLAENAARHGVYPKGDEGGTVTIRTYETTTAYVVEVIDDGVGFDVEEILARQGDSIGLKNMIFRMKSLMNADVAIDSRIGEGTKVTVTIPINSQAELPAQPAAELPPQAPETTDDKN